jgi:DNA-binding response OmpR family regulator
MATILVIGEGERAEMIARELAESGFQVDVCSPVDIAGGLGDNVSAIVVNVPSANDAHNLRAPLEVGSEKRPVLAVLPEEALAAEPLDVTADDVAFQPLRPRELEARLRRLLDRRGPVESPEVLRQGALAIDTAGYRVYVDGTLEELTFKEYELLRFLAMNPDRVYTREALLDKVWGYDYFGGARTVDVHIRRIRSKIERDGYTFIETVRGVGYRFHASS